MSSVNDWGQWFKANGHIEWALVGCLFISGIGIAFNGGSLLLFLLQPTAFSSIASNMTQAQTLDGLTFPFFGIYTPNLNQVTVIHSHLHYKVVGILFSENIQESQVVLRQVSGFDKIYHVGESITPGVVVKAIQPDGVVLDNQGQLERLNLSRKALNFSTPPPPLKLQQDQ